MRTHAEDPAAGRRQGPGRHGSQAAEPAEDDVEEDDDEDDVEEVDDDEEDEVFESEDDEDGFAAGLLLDDAPRESLR